MIQISRPACPEPDRLKSDYKYPTNKRALMNASFGKCMYCESKVEAVSFGDVEHIKPKSKYPNDEFNWDNLGIVCTRCNNAKSDTYDESCPPINPYTEDPSSHVVASGPLVFAKNGSVRGDLTILLTKLNRAELIESRQERLIQIDRAIQECQRMANQALKQQLLRVLVEDSHSDKEYSFVVRALLSTHSLV